jgi:hypothetical protein
MDKTGEHHLEVNIARVRRYKYSKTRKKRFS